MSYTYIVKIKFAGSVLSSFPINVIPFFIWLPFYQLGLLMGRLKSEKYDFSKWSAPWLLFIFAASLLLSMAEGLLILRHGYDFGGSQVKLFSFIESVTVFLLALRFSGNRILSKKTFISWVGENSFAIYLIHTLLIAFMAPIVGHYLNSNMAIFLVLMMVVIAGSAIVCGALQLLLPERFKIKMIG